MNNFKEVHGTPSGISIPHGIRFTVYVHDAIGDYNKYDETDFMMITNINEARNVDLYDLVKLQNALKHGVLYRWFRMKRLPKEHFVQLFMQNVFDKKRKKSYILIDVLGETRIISGLGVTGCIH